MSKSKNIKTTDKINDFAQQAGLMLMTAAATAGVMELPEHPNKVVVPNQPSLVLAVENSDNLNAQRREREETAPHFISFGETQRTPARSGKA